MSERLWDRADEWTDYIKCGGNADFITDPEALGPERTAAVVATCASCLVRPECIEMNTGPVTDPWSPKVRWSSNAIWVAGEWLPDESSATSRRELEKKREVLVGSIPYEYAARPDEIF